MHMQVDDAGSDTEKSGQGSQSESTSENWLAGHAKQDSRSKVGAGDGKGVVDVGEEEKE